MPIKFSFIKKIKIRNSASLKKIILKIFLDENKVLGNAQFIFCDDKYLLDINRKFLGHDYFTDVISFNMSETGSHFLSGEVYVSIEMVAFNSIKFKNTIEEELARVVFHGALHLCGYSDKSRTEKKNMRVKENLYLDQYFS